MDLLLGLDAEALPAIAATLTVDDEPVPNSAKEPACSKISEDSVKGTQCTERLARAGGTLGVTDHTLHAQGPAAADLQSSICVRDTGDGRGLGVFALRPFHKDDVVFTERPELAAVVRTEGAACDWCLRALCSCPSGLPHGEFWPVAPHETCCQICRTRWCCASCRKLAEACGHSRLCAAAATGRLAAFSDCCSQQLSVSADPRIVRGAALLVLRMVAHICSVAAEGDSDESRANALRLYTHLSGAEPGGDELGGPESAAARQLHSLLAPTLALSATEQAWIDEATIRRLLRGTLANFAQLQPISAFSDYVCASRRARYASGGASLAALRKHTEELRARHPERLADAMCPDAVGDEMYGVSGCGIFKLQSKLNHSCAPTVRRVCAFTDASLDLVACRDIAPGEELTNAYVDPALEGPRRRQILRATYGFVCACSKCAPERLQPSRRHEQANAEACRQAVEPESA